MRVDHLEKSLQKDGQEGARSPCPYIRSKARNPAKRGTDGLFTKPSKWNIIHSALNFCAYLQQPPVVCHSGLDPESSLFSGFPLSRNDDACAFIYVVMYSVRLFRAFSLFQSEIREFYSRRVFTPSHPSTLYDANPGSQIGI